MWLYKAIIHIKRCIVYTFKKKENIFVVKSLPSREKVCYNRRIVHTSFEIFCEYVEENKDRILEQYLTMDTTQEEFVTAAEILALYEWWTKDRHNDESMDLEMEYSEKLQRLARLYSELW
jgi:hypothetical protein